MIPSLTTDGIEKKDFLIVVIATHVASYTGPVIKLLVH